MIPFSSFSKLAAHICFNSVSVFLAIELLNVWSGKATVEKVCLSSQIGEPSRLLSKDYKRAGRGGGGGSQTDKATGPNHGRSALLIYLLFGPKVSWQRFSVSVFFVVAAAASAAVGWTALFLLSLLLLLLLLLDGRPVGWAKCFTDQMFKILAS